MDTFTAIPLPIQIGAVFFFGLMVGSFCNVCIYRLPRKESVSFPASHCPSCSEPVRAYDNIPVLSYLILGGKCRFCKNPISPIYPAIELVVGLLIAAAYLHFGLTWEFAIAFLLSPALVVITAIDLEHRIIPDRITLPGIVFGLAAGFYLEGWKDSLIGFFLAGGLFYLTAVLSKGGMGGGDIKYIAGAGALVGWQKVLLIIFMAALLGSIVGIVLMIFKGKTRKAMIPFGPFLAVATLVIFYYGDELLRWYLNLVMPPT